MTRNYKHRRIPVSESSYPVKPLFFAILLLFFLGATVPAPGQVIAPTLRDEVRKNGFVWHISYPEDRTLATFDLLISRSDLIVRGRVLTKRLAFQRMSFLSSPITRLRL